MLAVGTYRCVWIEKPFADNSSISSDFLSQYSKTS